MKVLLYQGGYNLVRKSGVGKAIDHQKEAFNKQGFDYTTNSNQDYDIIQLNTIFPDSVMAAFRAKHRGKKVVYYAHSTMEDFKNSFRGSNMIAPLFKKWIKWCYSFGDIIITPSDYSKHILEGYSINRPIISLTNGINLQFFQKEFGNRQLFRKKYSLSDDDQVVISVGHYIDRKGLPDFIEVAGRIPDCTFIWFGYTPKNLLTTEIRRAMKAKPQNLIFPGFIEKEELRDALCGCDAFLFLSYEETEGIALNEALAMKVPCIIRDIPIYKEKFPADESVFKGTCVDAFETLLLQLLAGKLPDLTEQAYRIVAKSNLDDVGAKLKIIHNQL